MVLVLSLSFIYIYFLGLELFYRIRQTKHVLYIMVFLSFFTGNFLAPLTQAWMHACWWVQVAASNYLGLSSSFAQLLNWM